MPRKSQKQLTAKYRDNLANYKRLYSWRRAMAAATILTFLGGLVAIWSYYKRAPDKFFNPGTVSSHHLNITPAMSLGASSGRPNDAGASNCDSCHDKSLVVGSGLSRRKFVDVLRDSFTKGASADRIQRIDQRCETCHSSLSQHAHTFHEPNAIQYRCSTCHQEHRGPGPMRLVASSECASCHGSAGKMLAAAHAAAANDWTPRKRHPQPQQRVVFEQLGRPTEGYTRVFSTFWDDHPEFRINLAKAADPKTVRDPDSYVAADGVHDILRFNHSRNFCHELEIEGRFMKRISFQANCQTCHQLQFDLKNPDLTLPHGDATAVLGFLRSVTSHYEDLARRKGITDPGKIRSFVDEQRKGLRTQYSSDQQLISRVFFEGDPYKLRPGMDRPRAANFAGCAYCHEVKPAAVGAPMITKPVLVDRWMLLSDFDHAKHVAVKEVDCQTCHQLARGSNRSSDILLPVKGSCIQCHSPHAEAGLRTAAECITCHNYHAPASAQATTVAEPHRSKLSLKQMMLAGNP
jgi:Cytochrome c7 and related cytochrome c